jgi:hypothetical protein
MRQLILGFLATTIITISSQAQKGRILVYGTMDVYTEKDPDYGKTTKFSKKYFADMRVNDINIKSMRHFVKTYTKC